MSTSKAKTTKISSVPPGYGRKIDAAAYANVSVRTVDRWIQAGLPVLKPNSAKQGLVLVRLSDVDAFLQRNAVAS